jgi:hypothetical protein
MNERPNSSIVFKVEKLSNEGIISKSTKLKERIVHLKGFGSKLEANYEIPIELVNQLCSFDIICFDGDNLASDSFTKIIAYIFSLNLEHNIRLWAFKYFDELFALHASWNEKIVSFNDYSMTVSQNLTLVPKDIKKVIIVHYAIMAQPTAINMLSNVRYAHLGIEALKITGALDVVSLIVL